MVAMAGIIVDVVDGGQGRGWRALSRVPDLDDVAVGIGEVGVGHAGGVLATPHQLPTSALDLLHALVELARTAEPEAEVRHATRSDRFVVSDLTQRDEVACTRRAEEDHLPALPELHLETERLLVELQGTVDVADVEVDVVESTGLDHGPPLRP